MSRTFRTMAYSHATHYDGYQDHVYRTQVMSREQVRQLYRQWCDGKIIDADRLHRCRELPLYNLAQAAHRTVFRNRCSYRQRITAIRKTKAARRSSERAQRLRETREIIYRVMIEDY